MESALSTNLPLASIDVLLISVNETIITSRVSRHLGYWDHRMFRFMKMAAKDGGHFVGAVSSMSFGTGQSQTRNSMGVRHMKVKRSFLSQVSKAAGRYLWRESDRGHTLRSFCVLHVNEWVFLLPKKKKDRWNMVSIMWRCHCVRQVEMYVNMEDIF